MIEKILERARAELFNLTFHKSERCKGFNDGIHTVMKIIQEESKNGGWIPCSEQMPQENKLILIYAESTARGGSIRCVAELRNGFWFAQIASDTLGLTGIGQFNVIAWQPLPAPYQKGE